ncbi:MAG: tetratricopeptide repeat protein [Candidatus Omnitrophica bacterium]|nr:tetratricopeptide repeat protein [Candidatus Omnitrophota bacterium]
MVKKIALVLLVAVALAGCSQKPVEKTGVEQAQQLLAEGAMFLKQSNVAQAIQSFASAIKVAPDYFESYYLLSETLIRLHQFSQAEAVLLAAANKFPDNGVVFYLLSVAQQGAGNIVPAIVAARKSIDIFTAQGDREGQQRSMILLAALVTEAKRLSGEQAAQNAEKDALQAAEKAEQIVTEATAGVPTPVDNASAQQP